MPATGCVIFHATAEDGGYQFTDPIRTIRALRIDDVADAVRAAEGASNDGCYVAGFLAYEAGAAFEPAAPRRSIDMPYAWFGVYDGVERIAAGDLSEITGTDDAEVTHSRFSVPRPRYRRHINAIRHLIREGDVYQINYTGQLRFDLQGRAAALFRQLVTRQPVPYAAYLDIGDVQIVSCSPELFFRRRGRRVVTRPMKGTAMRGGTRDEDDALERRLAADAKNRAENLMIVDLLRNDLSRCCVPGSVRAVRLFETERYETLIQMTSEIEGELHPGAGLADIVAALFPCGSITGAPKVRAMQHIDELEDEPRGVYCGAVGFIEPGGDAVFNVAIRTAVIRQSIGRMGIGSGVVWDSEADAEFDECLLKARFLTGTAESAPFYLIETMKVEDGRVPLLESHLDRLVHSAAHFGIPIDREQVAGQIASLAEEELACRIRLTVDEHGGVGLERKASGERPDHWRVILSRTRVDGQDPLRRHKTSRRELYNEKLARARELGFDEVLFLNERGEVVEGARSNLFIRKGRQWLTPPVSSGALPGVYRRHVLDSLPGSAEEVLYIEDVLRADAVYFSNAVVGLVAADGLHRAGDEAAGAAEFEARCAASPSDGLREQNRYTPHGSTTE